MTQNKTMAYGLKTKNATPVISNIFSNVVKIKLKKMHSHLKPIWQMIFFIHTPLPLNKTEEGEGGGETSGLMNLIGKQKLFSIIGFSQLFLINRSQDNPPVYLVTMEPLGLMKLSRK